MKSLNRSLIFLRFLSSSFTEGPADIKKLNDLQMVKGENEIEWNLEGRAGPKNTNLQVLKNALQTDILFN